MLWNLFSTSSSVLHSLHNNARATSKPHRTIQHFCRISESSQVRLMFFHIEQYTCAYLHSNDLNFKLLLATEVLGARTAQFERFTVLGKCQRKCPCLWIAFVQHRARKYSIYLFKCEHANYIFLQEQWSDDRGNEHEWEQVLNKNTANDHIQTHITVSTTQSKYFKLVFQESHNFIYFHLGCKNEHHTWRYMVKYGYHTIRPTFLCSGMKAHSKMKNALNFK